SAARTPARPVCGASASGLPVCEAPGPSVVAAASLAAAAPTTSAHASRPTATQDPSAPAMTFALDIAPTLPPPHKHCPAAPRSAAFAHGIFRPDSRRPGAGAAAAHDLPAS